MLQCNVTLSLCEKCPYWELFWSAFSHIRNEYVEISLRIQSECGKMQTRITPNTDTFYAVLSAWCTLKGDVNLNKLAAGRCRFVEVSVTF